MAVASSATISDTQHSEPNAAKTTKPNFIFIMTDDQDLHMDSLKYMPAVQEHFGNGGTFHEKHYCTVSQCCPSRVSLLTGKAAHNTNVTSVTDPYGTVYSSFRCQPCAFADFDQFHRRLSKIHIRRMERQVFACLAARCGLQYILYWKVHERPLYHQLQQTFSQRLERHRL